MKSACVGYTDSMYKRREGNMYVCVYIYIYIYIYIAVFFFDFREISKQGDWSKSIMIPHMGNKGEGELDCHKL